MRKRINFLIGVFISISLLFHSLYYFDAENACLIKISPSLLPSNWNSKDVIKIVKNTAPQEYAFMCKNIDTIDKNQACGGADGGCFYLNKKRTIFVGNDQNNIALTASIIIHELCHARQNLESRSLNEFECSAAGAKYLQSVLVY